jgi:hypothetical protein
MTSLPTSPHTHMGVRSRLWDMPVAVSTPLGSHLNVGLRVCICCCSVEFGTILLWFFVCDRTTVFWQAEKVRRVLCVMRNLACSTA